MTVDIVPVDLGARSYEVRIGPGLLGQAASQIAPLLRRQKVAVITDETVAEAHLMQLAASFLSQNITMTALSLPPGEATKGWLQLERCVEWLLEQKVERGDVVVAFGGGVVGDLVGFSAAILRRGGSVCAASHHAFGAGRQLCRGQDRDQQSAGQKPDRVFSSTKSGAG